MLLTCRNLMTNLKFYSNRTFSFQILSSKNSSAFCYQKLKYYPKNMCSQYFPSAGFRTDIKLCHGDSDSEDDLEPKVKVTFIRPNGEVVVVEGKVGKTVMEAATKYEGPFLMEAACEGQLACTTCHVYVDDGIEQDFAEATPEEEDLLDSAPFCKPQSRLGCQLRISKELSGARFTLPSATANFSVDKKKKAVDLPGS